MVLVVSRRARPNGLVGESEGTFQFMRLQGVLGVVYNEEAEVNGDDGGKECDSCRRFGPRGDAEGLSYTSNGRLETIILRGIRVIGQI